MRPALALALLPLIGCGYGAISVEGSFGDQDFVPAGTVFAVVDAHQEIDVPGGGVRIETRANKLVVLFFCEPALDPDLDWSQLSGSEIVDLRETVRRGDRLRVKDLLVSTLAEGAHLKATPQHSDFSFIALHGTEPLSANDDYTEVRPLGRQVTASLVVEEAALSEGGHLRAELTLARERASDQPANTATGAVTLRFDAPVVGERLGESNLRTLGF